MDANLRLLVDAADVDDPILRSVEDCVEWFLDGPLNEDDFIDRLCKSYAGGWDIEQLNTPAVRTIMRHARKVKREMT
jgi:hypothetical protein